MDRASFVEIVSGVPLIAAAICTGGDVHNFINISVVMIVLGGTIAATFVAFQFSDGIFAFRATGANQKGTCSNQSQW